MTDYVLKIRNYAGLVAGAKHYRGEVEGPYPTACHGGTMWSDLGQTCFEGHPLPRQEHWNVEAAWTIERWKRHMATPWEKRGDDAGQFTDIRTLIDTAVGRFLGQIPVRDWEDKAAGSPGDRLYYHWLPEMVLPESFTAEERERRDGLPLPGDLLAEVPAVEETAQEETSEPAAG